MAQLDDLRPAFLPLSWGEKVRFIEDYRAKRYADLHTIMEFDLTKELKTPKAKKEKKAREPKVSKKKLDLSGRTLEELELLKKLGVL